MNFWYIINILLLTLSECLGLKILLMPSSNTKSHFGVSNRLACALKAEGHNVTMFTPIFQHNMAYSVSPCNVTHHQFYSGPDDDEIQESHQKGLQRFVFSEAEFTSNNFLWFKNFSEITVHSCHNFSLQNATIDHLIRQNFDVSIIASLSFCPTIIASEMDLPVLWYSPGNYIQEVISDNVGMPSPLSFVPTGFISYSDRMSFTERMLNIFMTAYFKTLNLLPGFGIMAKEADIFKVNPTDVQPSLAMSSDIPLALINGEQVLDYPRPMLSSVVYMGELGEVKDDKNKVRKEKKQNAALSQDRLSQEWVDILKNPNLILFSFGTVADTDNMPSKMKQGLIEAFGEFKNYTIIWKVTSFFDLPHGYDHVKLSKWVPQRDVLASPNLRLFITHGGYNSLLETCQAGVPMIVIPLFADQAGNARRSERLGFALRLNKNQITKETVTEGMNEVLANDRYRQRAKKIAEILSDTIRPNEEILSHHVKMATKHYRRMPRQTMSQRLNWLQYYCLDVFVAFLGSIWVVFVLAKKVFQLIKIVYIKL